MKRPDINTMIIDCIRKGEPFLMSGKMPVNRKAIDDAIWNTGAKIFYGGDLAYYIRPNEGAGVELGDAIYIPHWRLYADERHWYHLQFHELIHWTESDKRLDWCFSKLMNELVAEIGVCYLANHFEMPTTYDQNQMPYVNFWKELIVKEPTAFERACKQADKAASYLIQAMAEK